MAVIREKQQFKIGPIGVARASQAASIEGQAVQESLSSLGRLAFDRASAYATKAGKEAGQAATVIDPETGMPVALQVPEGFGTIASEAYQRVSETRFQAAVDSEIKVKAFELSERYKNNRNGASQYSQAMRSYLSSMEKTADGVAFKSYIKDLGESYHDGTFAKMMANQADRERAEMIAAASDRFEDGLQAIEMMTAIHGADSEEVEVLESQISQGVSDNVNAGLFKKSSSPKSQKRIRLAKAQGELRKYITPNTSSEDISLINAAIGTQNPALLPEGYENIAAVIIGFGTDLTSLNKFESYSTEYLGDVQAASKIREAKEEEAVNLALAEEYALFGPWEQRVSGSILAKNKARVAFNEGIEVLSVVNSATTEFVDNNLSAIDYEIQALAEGNPLKAKIAENKRELNAAKLRATASAVIDNMINGSVKLSIMEVDSVIDLLMSTKTVSDIRDELPYTLSPESLSHIQGLKQLMLSSRDLDGSVRESVIKRFTQIKTAGDLNLSNYKILTPAQSAKIENNAFGLKLDESFGEFQEDLKSKQIELQKLRQAGLTTSADNLQSAIEDSIVAYSDGIIRRTTLNLGKDRLATLRKSAERKNGAFIGGSNGEAINMLRNLENIYPSKGESNIWTKLNSHISTYTLGGAEVRSAQDAERKIRDESGAAKSLVEMSSVIEATSKEVNPENISSNFVSVASAINSIPNLEDDLRITALDTLRVNSSKAAFINFLATNPTPSQLDDFSSYFNGVISGTGSLDSNQASLVNAAKAYADGISESDKDFRSQLTTTFNGGIADAKATLNKIKKDKEFANDSRNLVLGLLPQGEGQIVMDQLLDDQGIDPLKAFQDPSYLASEEGNQLFGLIKQSGVLPSTWKNVFARIADGGFASMPGMDIETAFSLYENLRTHEYAGMKTESVIISSLSDEQKYTLEFMSVATKSFGVSPQVLTEAFQNAPRMKSSEFTDLMKTTFKIDEDSDLSSIAQEVDGYFDVSAETQRTLQVMTQTFMSRSMQGGVFITKKDVIDYAEKWMKDNRPKRGITLDPKSNEYVYDANARRSQYNLNQTVPGNEDAFIEYSQLVFDAAVSGTNLEGSIQFGPRFELDPNAGEPGLVRNNRSETASLRPAGKARDGSQLYQFVIHSEFGSLSPLMSNIYVDTPDGGKIVGTAPLYISTNDKGFQNIVKKYKGLYYDDVEEKRLKLIRKTNTNRQLKDANPSFIPYPDIKPGQGYGVEAFGPGVE